MSLQPTVVFVHSVWHTTRSYSHAIASLASVLLTSIPQIKVSVVTIRNEDHQQYASEIAALEPDVVFFTAMSNQWRLICSVASTVHKLEPRALLVCGGIHLTARPFTTLRDSFDVVVSGEGEGVISDIVQRRTEFRPLTGPRRTTPLQGEPVSDLRTLPIPRVDLFEKADVLAYPSLMFSRGCPYKCNYCMSRNGGLSSRVRWKSPQQAVSEIKSLIAYCGPEQIYIDDDTLLKNPRWLSDFGPLYKREVGLPFSCNARPETVRPAVIRTVKEAGCQTIGIGIESGSDRIREQLGRPMTDETIIQAFRTARAAGLETWSFNMVGVPGETHEDLVKTISLNKEAEVDHVRVSIYTPYPGAPMGELVEIGEDGYFRSPASLPPDMRRLYTRWIKDLDNQGRLWLTEVERGLVLEASEDEL